MPYPFHLIAVFVDSKLNYKGNNAAVVETEKPLSDALMQEIAADLNQPATTFLWSHEDGYRVQWFAPDAEIGLCGHGSLAAFAYLDEKEVNSLHYNSGTIKGKKNEDQTYSMFLSPILSSPAGKPDPAISKGLDKKIIEYYSNNNKNIVVLEDEKAVRMLKPDFSILKNMGPFGIIVTAKGEKADFVSRTLVPKVQQLEDHATGSSHAALTPFWSSRLHKEKMTGYQLSPRGGKFNCEFTGDEVILSGHSKLIASGEVHDQNHSLSNS